LRHTGLPPGQFPANKRDKNPAGCASNANYLNCRAVGFNDLLAAPMIPVKAILITFE
jgi:hypothetical protein